MNFIKAVLNLFIYFLVLGIPLMCLIALIKYVFFVWMKKVKPTQKYGSLIADLEKKYHEDEMKFLADRKEIEDALKMLDKDIEMAKAELKDE